jgi:type I restriction enzyme S subunit
MTTSKGTKMPRGDKVAIMQYPINLPPLATQQKIATILSSLDDKIELNNKINDNLEQQAQAIFKSFSSKSLALTKFTDEIEILGGGTPKTDNKDFWNGNIPFFKHLAVPLKNSSFVIV